MKKYLLLSISIIFLFTSSYANENWEFVKADEYCYIKSEPIKTQIPEGKSRGDHYLLVYKINQKPELIIQITSGFNYKSSDAITVQIDEEDYNFYTDDDTAWAIDEKEDKKVIYAMKKGLEFIASGISNKGTTVIDTYTLKGFTLAVKTLSNDC